MDENNVIGVDDIAITFRHLATIRCNDEPNMLESHEWLNMSDNTNVVKKFMPKSRINKMPRCVFCTADIHINRRPILLFFRINQ